MVFFNGLKPPGSPPRPVKNWNTTHPGNTTHSRRATVTHPMSRGHMSKINRVPCRKTKPRHRSHDRASRSIGCHSPRDRHPADPPLPTRLPSGESARNSHESNTAGSRVDSRHTGSRVDSATTGGSVPRSRPLVQGVTRTLKRISKVCPWVILGWAWRVGQAPPLWLRPLGPPGTPMVPYGANGAELLI